MRTHGLLHGHQEVSPNVQPNQVEERAMIGPDPTKDPLLAKVVNRMTCDTFLREDLMQEATLHLWKMKRQRPGETLSWYLQSCAFRLRHYLASGRSVDSPKRRALQVELAEEAELLECLKTDSSVIGQVEAREIVHQLSRALTPREQAILKYLADGLGPREIACRMKFSHPVAIKCRRKIAALVVRMGIAPRLAKARRTGPRRANGKVLRKPDAVPVHSTDQATPRTESMGPSSSLVAETTHANGITPGMPSDDRAPATSALIERGSPDPLQY